MWEAIPVNVHKGMEVSEKKKKSEFVFCFAFKSFLL